MRTVKGEYTANNGTNSQGNRYAARNYDSGQNTYRYSNRDGSYHYKNADGSKYHNNGRGSSTYTSRDGNVHRSSST